MRGQIHLKDTTLFRWAQINFDCLSVLQVCFLDILVYVSSIRTSSTTILRLICFFVYVRIKKKLKRTFSVLQVSVRFCITNICYSFFVSVRFCITNICYSFFVSVCSFLFVSVLQIFVTVFSFLYYKYLLQFFFVPVRFCITNIVTIFRFCSYSILNERLCLPILYYKFLFIYVLQVSALPILFVNMFCFYPSKMASPSTSVNPIPNHG